MVAHSMHTFTEVVNEVIAWSEKQRNEEWDLGCVGAHSIGSEESTGKLRNSFFIVRGNGRHLIVLGDVKTGFFDKLRHALESNPAVTTVLLGSNGGAVYEALMAGRYLRQIGVSTELWNNCRSACVLVFLGGVERRINAPYPALGFHQISVNGLAIGRSDVPYADVATYAEEMGVDSTALVRLMQLRPPGGMLDIKYSHGGMSDLLCNFRIATVVQRGCSSKDLHARPIKRSAARAQPHSTGDRKSDDPLATRGDPLSLDYDPLAPGAYKRYLSGR